MGIFSRGSKKTLAAVFDIGSSSVGGALVALSKGKAPEILFAAREPILVLPELDPDQFLSLTLKSLEAVAAAVAASKAGAPEKIFAVLGSPWYSSQTRMIRMEKNSEFAFSAKLADELVAKELTQFREEHELKYLADEEKVVPIELKNMRIALNGYVTPEPIGKRASKLEMTIFVSMSGRQFLNKVRETMGKHFHRDEVKFSSFLMASFTAVRDLYPASQFLLLDGGGELTTVSLVKGDILSESGTFAIGHNFIIRETARELGKTLPDAKTLFMLFKEGHESERQKVKLENAIGAARAKWLEAFQKSLATLSGDISIPSDVYVTADPDFAEFFADAIKGEQLSQYTLTDSKLQVHLFNPDSITGKMSFSANARHDPILSLESVYINRYL
ncbi:MAG: hypothetical protein AAB500_02190 [Patescibacteria group bacterium]